MADAKPLPSFDELHRVFDYDPYTGVLRWKIAPANGVRIGDACNHVALNGYVTVKWRRQDYKVHRVAWKMMTGEDAVTIDHVNHVRGDNVFSNLRAATQLEQNNNRYIFKFTRSEIEARISVLSARHTKAEKNLHAKDTPSKETLDRLFSYDLLTGLLTHKTGTLNGKRKIGSVVSLVCTGYLKTSITGKEFYAHRIIWKMMTGKDANVVDHIDGNGQNNAWANLRDVRWHQNAGNTKLPRHNTSGVKGVYWAKEKQRWTAQISIGDKIRYLGRFKTIEEAKVVYNAAALLHFGFISERAA